MIWAAPRWMMVPLMRWHVWLANSDWALYKSLKATQKPKDRRYAEQHLRAFNKRAPKVRKLFAELNEGVTNGEETI